MRSWRSKDIFCQRLPLADLHLVDVFLDEASLCYNPAVSQKHSFVFLNCNSPGHKIQNERLQDLCTFSIFQFSRGMWKSLKIRTIKVKNKSIKTRCEISPSLTIKTSWKLSEVQDVSKKSWRRMAKMNRFVLIKSS